MKIICHMQNGHPLAHYRSGVVVPGKPAELDVTEDQLAELRADCRVLFLDSLPTASNKPTLESEGNEEGDGVKVGEDPKPISRMNRGELQDVAREKGIDPEQTKKKLLAAIIAVAE